MCGRIQRIQALNDLVTTDRDFCAQVIAALKARDAKRVVSLASERGLAVLADDLFPSESADLDQRELASVAGGAAAEAAAQVAELFAAPGGIADALVQRWQGLL